VNAHWDPKGVPHPLQGTHVVRVPMRQQDRANRGMTHCSHDRLRIRTRIHDGRLARHWTAQ
jgi:hypothetical protein